MSKLAGKHVTLVPLSADHHDALAEACADGELFKLWYTSVPSPADMRSAIAERLEWQAAGSMQPFTVMDANGVPVGMTTFCNIEPDVPRLEIGYTWYARRVQRTPLNTECKLLLLTHAFEERHCLAVEFRTSFFNHASRRAIERLGAKLDGVLRCHRRHDDGSLRDTCVYSITHAEWPTVRQHLSALLRSRKAANEPDER
ncbi:MAG: GNAT family protein [Pseudomonadota bacterium]